MNMKLNNQQGQALIILVFAMLALLAFAALAIDGGNIYAVKRRTQNAADAAALAGTRQLVLECVNDIPSGGAIRLQVQQMVDANVPGATFDAYYVDASGQRIVGASGPLEVSASVDVPCGCADWSAKGMEVVAKNSTATFIAGLIGRPRVDVSALAKARYGPVIPERALGPFTRSMSETFTYGDTYMLREIDVNKDHPSASDTGNFGWLRWNPSDSPSVPTLEAEMVGTKNPWSGYADPTDPGDHTLDVGNWISTITGNKNSSQVRTQLDKLMKRPFLIPLYTEIVGKGENLRFKVGGFAVFEMSCYNFGGGGNMGGNCTIGDRGIEGKFVKRATTIGDWATNVACDQEVGLYSVKLVP